MPHKEYRKAAKACQYDKRLIAESTAIQRKRVFRKNARINIGNKMKKQKTKFIISMIVLLMFMILAIYIGWVFIAKSIINAGLLYMSGALTIDIIVDTILKCVIGYVSAGVVVLVGYIVVKLLN